MCWFGFLREIEDLPWSARQSPKVPSQGWCTFFHAFAMLSHLPHLNCRKCFPVCYCFVLLRLLCEMLQFSVWQWFSFCSIIIGFASVPDLRASYFLSNGGAFTKADQSRVRAKRLSEDQLKEEMCCPRCRNCWAKMEGFTHQGVAKRKLLFMFISNSNSQIPRERERMPLF